MPPKRTYAGGSKSSREDEEEAVNIFILKRKRKIPKRQFKLRSAPVQFTVMSRSKHSGKTIYTQHDKRKRPLDREKHAERQRG